MSSTGRASTWLAVPCLLLLITAPATAEPADTVARGRYIAVISGCNDCHTPAFMQKGGEVPESEWLIGSHVGWHGPWGTTYASNLRARARSMTEAQWVAFNRNLKSRPPMPYWSLNSMTEADLAALHAYLVSLPANDTPVPGYVEPGRAPETPYVDLSLRGLPGDPP